MPYVLSTAADEDAYAIIAEAMRLDPRRARVIDAELEDLLERIGENPGIGARKAALTARPYRFKLFRERWWVVYTDVPKGQMVQVVRILWVHADLVNALLD